MTGTAAIWLSGYSLMYSVSAAPLAAAWSVIGTFRALSLLPASVYHLTVASLRLYDRYKRHVWLSLGGFRAVSNHGFSGYTFVSDARQDAWDYYLIYSWMAALFVCFFFVLMGLSLHHDWTAIRTAVLGIGKLWNRGLLAAFCTAYLGSVDYLPGHSVYRSIRSVLGLVIWSSPIRRHRLVDITPNSLPEKLLMPWTMPFCSWTTMASSIANRSPCGMFARTKTDFESTPCSALARVFWSDPEELARQILSVPGADTNALPTAVHGSPVSPRSSCATSVTLPPAAST